MNDKFLNVVKQYPDLPVVFKVHNDEVCDDYTVTVFEDYYVSTGTVYFDDEQYFDDDSEVVEKYMDYFSDEEKYQTLSDKEYENEIKKWVEENIRHYKAIIVSIG